MDWVSEIPLVWRLPVVFLIGTFIGGQLNRGIYRLAWNPRHIGPWSPPDPAAPRRRSWSRLPIVGWLGMRDESPLHGRGYWVRPLLIELAVGVGFAWLYWWEMGGGLLPQLPNLTFPNAATLHAQYVAHVFLISLMMVATFIDFDEKTIPDEITVPGTLLGLMWAALAPTSLLPVVEQAFRDVGPSVGTLHIASPLVWPTTLDSPRGLICGIACFVGWCLAISPWVWITRRGLAKAVQFLMASLLRHPFTKWLALLAVVGSLAIAGVWWHGGFAWRSLLTALVGLAFGGGLIWSVRIVGSWALGQEAMGFGDVTLMAMVGSFVGWQAALMTFFLAPFAALIISVAQFVLTRRKDIAFGPYLCLGALGLIVGWARVWHGNAAPLFQTGWLIPGMVGVCLVLMGLMLGVWRQIRDRWLFPEEWEETSPESSSEPLAHEADVLQPQTTNESPIEGPMTAGADCPADLPVPPRKGEDAG